MNSLVSLHVGASLKLKLFRAIHAAVVTSRTLARVCIVVGVDRQRVSVGRMVDMPVCVSMVWLGVGNLVRGPRSFDKAHAWKALDPTAGGEYCASV